MYRKNKIYRKSVLDSYKYKEQLFLHLDGITIIPTILAVKKIGILSFLEKKQSFTLFDIENEFKINKGYFRIAVRTLLSIGIFKLANKNKPDIDVTYIVNHQKLNLIMKITDNDDTIFLKLMAIYIDFKSIADNMVPLTDESLNLLKSIVGILKNKKNILLENKNNKSEEDIYYFIEGIIVGPLLSYLGYYNLSKKDIKNQNFAVYIEKILEICGLINLTGEFTEKGLFFKKRLASYGVTSSYLPLLINLESILLKNTNLVWKRDQEGDEIHVNRALNVWGSGGAHKYYFDYIDKIIIDIFNKDINKQPKGIIDVGCGDGTFLKHCYDLIKSSTIRGKYLREHPLTLIGVDINKTARIESRKKLNSYDISNIILNGNISDPQSLNKKLNSEYNRDLNDFLSTRTFLDHNRIYENPKELRATTINTSGSFCYKGQFIDKKYLINNLIEHLSNWKKYIEKHGLIILELHTIDPYLTMINRGKTLACAYDTTHGFSDQYLVEYDTFIKCAEIAKLNLNRKSILFPDKEIPTISINYFI